MGVFFSKKKQSSRVTDQDKAVLQLKQTRDKIKQYQKKIEQSLEKERSLAKQLLQNGQKERALLLLRKKKFQEQLLNKTDGQLENLERLTHDLEFAQVEIKVVDGLKAGNVALKKLHEILSIDEIERVLDETREGVEKQQELDEILSGALTEEDESQVEAELEALIGDTVEVVQDISLPDVPEDLPKETKEKKITEKEPQAVALEA